MDPAAEEPAPAQVVIHDGPIVPDTEYSSGPLASYGDWVATTINATSLLVQEDDGDGQYIESIVRLDLTKLDSLAAGLQ